MCPDLFHGGSTIAIVAKQAQNEFFERITESSTVNFGKVSVNSATEDQPIEVFLFASLLEGEDALDDNEENHAEGEQIDLCALVGLALFDFRGHVSHRASITLERVDAFVAGEAKVSDL